MTFLKVLGMLLALCAMVGFGICGVCGLGLGVSSGRGADTIGIVILGLLGLGISVVAFFAFRALLRSFRSQ